MKRGTTIIALLFFSAALVISYFDRGWETGPIEITEDIRAMACAGELQGFYSYIDKEAVEHSLKKTELERMRKDFIFSSQAEPDGKLGVKDIIVNSVPELISLKWQMIDDQVRAGEFGPICNMEIVRVKDEESAVKIKFPGGERTTWSFAKVGEEWKLVSIKDVLPLTVASLESGKENAMSVRPEPEKVPSKETLPEVVEKETGDGPVSAEDTSTRFMEKDALDIPREAPDDIIQEPTIVEDSAVETASVAKPKGSEVSSLRALGHDFRNTRWGMTPSQVAAAEGTEPGTKAQEELVYNTYYRGQSVKVRYKFSENGLKSGGVVFLNEHPEEIFYVQDYINMSGEIWYNRLYEGKPERMGFAVSIGHLKLRTKWRTVSSDILLELKSENYNMNLVLSYHSR